MWGRRARGLNVGKVQRDPEPNVNERCDVS